MPHTIVVPTVTQGLVFSDLRKAIRDCIKLVAPDAVVYSSWPLKFDIGKTVNLLRSQADGNKVHAWIIDVNRAEVDDKKAGGYQLEWILNVRIWGFVGYEATHDDSVQSTIEDEVRAITQVLHVNRKHLGLDDTSALKEVGLVVWDNIEVNAFGSGEDVHVAQGNLEIRLSENFSLA